MKKRISISTLLTLSILFFNNSIRSQITLEATYPNSALKLYMVDLELSGMKYVVQDNTAGNRSLRFYNLNHGIWKIINCNFFPMMPLCTGSTNYDFDALYISETLFDCDDKIEFMYISNGGCRVFTGVYNETGVPLLYADSCVPLVRTNVPQQFRPIYNTPNGTKLILSHKDGSARVYDLPCELSAGVDQLVVDDGKSIEMNISPNPSFYETTVEFTLPDYVTEAELIISNMEGKEVKRYRIDKYFNSLLVAQDELSPGTYVYSIVSDNKVLISRKLILYK